MTLAVSAAFVATRPTARRSCMGVVAFGSTRRGLESM
jgi:hypothetical protein